MSGEYLGPLPEEVQKYKDLASREAARIGAPPGLFLGLVEGESAWNPYAKNPKSSARGLGQHLDATWRDLGHEVTGDEQDLRHDPETSIKGTADLLQQKYQRTGDWEKAVKAYGEGTDPYLTRILGIAQKNYGYGPAGEYLGPLEAEAPGIITPGNIDLYHRPIVKNKDGTISTVVSMSFNDQGKEVLIPMVSDDGRIMEVQEAINHYRRTGKHLGIFDSPQNATAYAKSLHESQAKLYPDQGKPGEYLGPLEDKKPGGPAQPLNVEEQLLYAAGMGLPTRKPKSLMMDDETYEELNRKYPIFKDEAISASKEEKEAFKSPYLAPTERFEELRAEKASLGERFLASMGQVVPPEVIAGLGGEGLPEKERREEIRAARPFQGERIPRLRAYEASTFELLSKNIAAVNRPILESLVGYAGIAEDVLALPYRTITGDKSPIARPLTAIAARLKERGAPEQLRPDEDEWLATLPGQVVGGLGAYLLPGKLMPAGGVSLFEKFLHNLGIFVPADVALGYAQGGEAGAKRGLISAVPTAAAFTVAQVLPGRPLQTVGTGAVFAGSAAAGGERDPKKLTADFLTGMGLHWLGSRGEARAEKFEKFVEDWKREHGVSEKEFEQVKENLGTPAPEEEKPLSLKEKYQREIAIFAKEPADNRLPPEELENIAARLDQGQTLAEASGGRELAPGAAPKVQGGGAPAPLVFPGVQQPQIPEWTVRTTPRGKEVNYKSGESAGKAAAWINRNRPEMEARATETPAGWRLEVRSRPARPAEPGPTRAILPSGEVLELGPEGWQQAQEKPAEAPVEVMQTPVSEIKTAAEDFQFKLGAEPETGAGLALKDVKKWDPGLAGIITVWRSPERELFVVNGHQRLALARRQRVGEVNTRVLDSAEWSKPEARAYGALINIAEGRGTAVDMAKFFRDTGYTQEALAEQGVSLTEAKTRKALALKELSDGLFHETALGRLPEERAVIIGRELAGNHPAQEAMHRVMRDLEAKGQEVSNEKLRELLRLGKNAPVLKGEQRALFGVEELKKSLLLEQAELLAYAKKQLRRDKSVFGTVVREKARLRDAGNVIDPETNQAVSRQAAEALDLLDKAVYLRDSEAHRALNEAAFNLAAGKDKTQIKANFYGRLKKALKADRGKLFRPGGEAGPGSGKDHPEAGRALPPGTKGARTAGDAAAVRAPAAPGGPGGPRPPEVTPEQVQRLYPDISPEQAAILAHDPELRAQFAQGNWEAYARQKAQGQVSDQGSQESLEGLGTGLFEDRKPEPPPSPRGIEGVKGVQAGKPEPPVQVPGLDAEPGQARAPDPEIGLDGEIKKFYSGGPDTGEMARKLETRLWEALAHAKIRPPGKYLQKRMAERVPGAFMPGASEFKKFLSFAYFPRWVAEKWDSFRAFYEGDLRADDIMANHRYEVWGRLQPYFKELSAKDRKRVHAAALKLDEIKSAEKRRGTEEEIDSQGADWFRRKMGLSAREANAAHGLFDAYRYVRLETVKAMQQDVVDLGMKHGLNEATAREFAEDVLDRRLGQAGEADSLWYVIDRYFPGRSEGLYEVLRRQRENYEFWSRERALYMFPHTRWGPYWLYVWERGSGPEGADSLRWAGAAESIGEYKKMRAGVEKDFAGQEVEFREVRKEKVPMELYNNVDMPGLAAIMELARDRFEAESWTKFLEAKQAFFAQKGWGSHKIHREGVPGFETENDKRVISDYFEGWIGMQGKTHRVRAFSDAWQGFKKRRGGDNEGLMKYTQSYVNYLLEHPREATKIRTLLYHLYLGGSMGFRVLHGLHALQTAWPEMRVISKRPGAALARAIKDRTQLLAFEQGWSKTPGISGEELAALEQGRRKAALSTDYTAEMAVRSNSPMSRFLSEEPQGPAAKLKRAFDLIYYPTALDRGTRESIFLAAVRELRGKGPITGGVIERAAEIVNNSMYRYARGERPRWMRREGATATIFQTWSMKYFEQIFRYVRDGQYPALGRLLAAAGLVGGLNALGVKDALTYAYRKVYGRDAEDDSKKYLQAVLGDTGGEVLNRISFRGLPAGLGGFDLSQRMVHHLPWNYLFGILEHPYRLAGAVTGPVEGADRALRALSENQPGRALEQVAPTWLRNPQAAKRLYEKGPETLSGRPILGRDFKRQKATLGEAARKAVGLQPTRLSEEQGYRETVKHLQEAVAAKVRDWSSRFAQAIQEKDREGRAQVLAELREHNRKMKEARRFGDMVLPSQFRAAVQIRLRPVFSEKSRRRSALRERR